MAIMLLFTITGILLIALAVPLVRRAVPPNELYGLRVPATFADEWVWYEANARTGRDFIVFGSIQLALAVLLLFIPAASDVVYALANAAVLFVGTIVVAVVGWRRANRLLATRRAGGEPLTAQDVR